MCNVKCKSTTKEGRQGMNNNMYKKKSENQVPDEGGRNVGYQFKKPVLFCSQ